jgi:hypothetical protein
MTSVSKLESVTLAVNDDMAPSETACLPRSHS